MNTNLRDRIHQIFSSFIIKVYRLARRMNLRQIFPALELLARKLDLLQSNEDTRNPFVANGGPLYSLGCSPTAAKYNLKTDEASDFPNIYPGTMPLDGSWGTFEDNQGDIYSVHPLIATELTLEQRWDSYLSTEPDPDLGWRDLSADQVGVFMRSSVYDLGGDFDGDGNPDHNYDGETTFFTYDSGDST